MIFFTKKTLLGGLEILKKFKMRIAGIHAAILILAFLRKKL
jgi:hypothetical protein